MDYKSKIHSLQTDSLRTVFFFSFRIIFSVPTQQLLVHKNFMEAQLGAAARRKGFGFSRPAAFGGQPNAMLANREESYKSLQLTFPFQPHTARFVVSRPHLARNGSNFDLFSIVGYFCYDGVKSQKGTVFCGLVILVPPILYFRANKRTTTIFPHSQKEKQRKEMSNTNRTERTSCEQDKPYCQRD